MSWIFHPSEPMGGAAGEAYANTLKSPGMEPEHVLAREAIQNSVDARVPTAEKVLVRFRARTLKGAGKRRFVEAAGLEAIAARKQFLELPSPNCLAKLDSASEPLDVLYVEDFNTEGLSGPAHDSRSNFYRLLLSLGDRSKLRRAEGSGGSYGFGKSVYSSSSSIQTLFAYTRFIDADSGKSVSRAFGCGYYASHEYKNKPFSGRAWLGRKQRADAQGRAVVDPHEGSAADELAEKLGFSMRGTGDTGTTILIIDTPMKLDEIQRGIEDWWWPRLIEDKLDVELIDGNGTSSLPRPKKREDLRPFIEAYDIAQERAVPAPGQQKFHRPNKLDGRELGSCGFGIVPLNDQGTVVRDDLLNTVAMIRAPLMVVAYKRFSETAPYVIGAYLAGADVDRALKLSEPPAHDKWDPASTNLRDETGDNRKVVDAVLSRVKAGLKRFQAEAAPPPPPRQKRLNMLERALASFFKPQGLGRRGPPDPSYSPIHIAFSTHPEATPAEEGLLRLRAAFSVSLDERCDEESVQLKLRVATPVLEDSDQEGDEIPVAVSCDGTDYEPVAGDPAAVTFELARGEKADFEVESAPYDPSWTVRLRPEVDRQEAVR